MPLWNMSEKVADISKAAIANLYETLAKRNDWEFIVVDNGSTHPVKGIGKYIGNEMNRGVAAAWNQGIGKAKGEYVVFINSDSFPHGDWLEWLLWGIEQPAIGAVSPTACEPEQLEAITIRNSALMGGACGSCFLMRRRTFGEIGLFDERFAPAYYEDEDMWRRLEMRGLETRNVTRCCMTHKHSSSANQIANLDEIKERNKRVFEEKWHGQK